MIEKIYVKPYVLELYCDDCNINRVIPARLEQIYSKKAVL